MVIEAFKKRINFYLLAKCNVSTDCGVTGLTNKKTCNAKKELFAEHFNYTCNDPETIKAKCSLKKTLKKVEKCSFKCSKGACINPCVGVACSAYCNKKTLYSYGVCKDSSGKCVYNKNIVNSPKCTGLAPLCYNDSECGKGVWKEKTTCKDGDVYDTLAKPTCSDSGKINSKCSVVNKITKKNTCAFGCSAGACKESKKDCPFGVCGKLGKKDTPKKINKSVVCKKDSDCGSVQWGNNTVCKRGNVYGTKIMPSCIHPGSENAMCTWFSTPRSLKENCTYDCENGKCLSRIIPKIDEKKEFPLINRNPPVNKKMIGERIGEQIREREIYIDRGVLLYSDEFPSQYEYIVSLLYM